MLQVYGADAWGWRGWFAIHTWIAAKRKNEDFYTIYDVVGWRGYYGHAVVGINRDIPDRRWYGARPRLLKDYQGAEAEALIDAVDEGVRANPEECLMWADMADTPFVRKLQAAGLIPPP